VDWSIEKFEAARDVSPRAASNFSFFPSQPGRGDHDGMQGGFADVGRYLKGTTPKV
jgi:hypothetical protein